MRLRRCTACGAYTLSETHCSVGSANPHPPRYSAEDKYASYRRKARHGG
ncbi:ribosome biogenesis protein [Candidatus Micrarchaeota archaeon CG_4_10_14_0_2_um_filter_60_11]|nr:MAG: ribosome biogenesis protein [Candidatus Micrarchaeota archaeon CG10_big_fil_rev_8_21_14_0_10_60_32]PIO01854.1 MAG: ribosome biogenesis protein [Candidatus Micrarchaeota archaeon CG09_land_8_20_14_0_10_60_16]PIY91787.1 MAG: ribosome biogenesis protein [Candidatus Micrarchaeota archaeon CG_4_10_14_0_8_um_filter_60_7]PIZ90865.1 MAG: ribosome biogenesis protein [Candidatus Micrarchaeota archaeon CG_4_10_14_0_2_um_filter_60_11]